MAGMKWTKEAEEALGRAPFFVRGMVRRKVEERALARGREVVGIDDWREAEARFRSVTAGKSAGELEAMMPRDNAPGVDMTVIEVCHNELSGCPNVLIKTSEWKKALEERLAARGVSERLRARVSGDKILYHHKLRFAVAGCPNGCSRPQIADVALVGFVAPSVDPADCTACGACADVCPDAAVSVDDGPPVFDMDACQGCTKCRDICPRGCIALSTSGVRLLLGGKLGRHPRFAARAGEFEAVGEAVERISEVVEEYIGSAAAEERFADWYARTHAKEARPI